MKGMGQMGKLMKQAQKMQADLARAQEEVTQMEIEYSAGGDAVTIKINGALELVSLKIDPEAVDPDDVETLEDLILTAVNGAVKAIRDKSDERIAKVTGAMGGLPGMPF